MALLQPQQTFLNSILFKFNIVRYSILIGIPAIIILAIVYNHRKEKTEIKWFYLKSVTDKKMILIKEMTVIRKQISSHPTSIIHHVPREFIETILTFQLLSRICWLSTGERTLNALIKGMHVYLMNIIFWRMGTSVSGKNLCEIGWWALVSIRIQLMLCDWGPET